MWLVGHEVSLTAVWGLTSPWGLMVWDRHCPGKRLDRQALRCASSPSSPLLILFSSVTHVVLHAVVSCASRMGSDTFLSLLMFARQVRCCRPVHRLLGC